MSYTKFGAGRLLGVLCAMVASAYSVTTVNAGTVEAAVLVGDGRTVSNSGRLLGLEVGADESVENTGALDNSFGSDPTVRLGNGSSDLLAVNGNAQLDSGTVAVLAASGTYDISTRYTVLTAGGGVTGELGDVNVDAAFLDPSLSYEPDAVTLVSASVNVSWQAQLAYEGLAGQRHNAHGLSLGLRVRW